MESVLAFFTTSLTPASPWLFVAAFVAGILNVCTPCVLPMVPLTLSVIGTSATATRAQRTMRSGIFALGIVVTYTTLGSLAGSTGGMMSAVFQHTMTHVVLAGIFLALAAAAFGFWTMQLPEGLRNASARIPNHGLIGAFGSGLIAGLLALPCTGPTLATLLLIVGSQGSGLAGAALLAVHAVGFALPFVCIGIGLAKLPRRGPWLDGVKHAIGIALLVSAFWFLRAAVPVLRDFGAVLPSPHVIVIAIVTVVAMGLSVHATVRMSHGALQGTVLPASVLRAAQRARTGGIALILIGATLVMNALLTTRRGDWCDGSTDGTCLAHACPAHELTIVDFGAPWCASCVQLERTTFADPEVTAALAQHGRVYIDIDQQEDVQERYRIAGVPAILFFDRSCSREVHRIHGYVDASRFLEELRIAQRAVQ